MEERLPYVRVARIEIDPERLEAYRAALREEIEASVRLEPGVLALHAVAERDDPTRVVVFEIYADPAAYAAHLGTPHFRKYKAATEGMVKGLTLVDMEPIALATRSSLSNPGDEG